MSSIRFAACVLALSQSASAWQETSTIGGQILNALTALPIRKAIVQLTGPASLPTEQARETDAEGHFSFAGLPAGDYHLNASRDGYSNRALRSRIVVSAGDHRSDIVLKLPPLSVITGKVVDEAGEPVTELEVSALKLQYREGKREWVVAASGTTSDIGEYRIPKLTPGRYLVKTSSRSSGLVRWKQLPNQPLPDTPDTIYPDTYYPGAIDESVAVPVQVRTGAEVRGMDIALAPVRTFRIRAKIIKPPGTAASVAWERKGSGRRQIERSIPATENSFELRGKVPGIYILYAEPDDDSNLRALAMQTVVLTDRHVDGVVMNMVPASDIPGEIKVEGATTKYNLSKLNIELRTSAIYFHEPSSVAANLKFILKDVAPAHFEVDVHDLPAECFVRFIRYGGADITTAGADFVTGNTLEVTLSATAGQIGGSVVDSEGNQLGGAIVALISKDGAPLRQIISEENGTFAFGSLKPGDYKLVALDGEEADAEAIEQLAIKAEVVTIEASGHKTLQLKAIPVNN